jgi:N-acetylglucosaminyldiphosphoundecaprenol N-acetyl-beta-D-mannosaminyltransferase
VVPKGAGRLILWLHLHRLPALLNILKGDMSFIGPRVVSPDQISLREQAARKRYNVRPGLVCLWWIRKRANIAYGDEFESDGEYVETYSLWGDMGITLRSIPAILYGEGVATAPDEIKILGIPIHNVTMSETIAHMIHYMGQDTPSQICFVNADCANIAYRNPEYLGLLQQSTLSLADGIGLKLAGKLLGRDIKQNVNGTDLFPRLCEALADTDYGLYLLGARPEVVDRVRNWIETHYPNVRVCGTHHGYYTSEEESHVIDDIAHSGAALLLVAFGAPRQDLWIGQHLSELGVKAAVGVGGLFDYYSGRISRAPLWMREMGLEWVYRFYKEPRRMWKRYGIGNVLFLLRVMKEKYLGIAP